MDEDQLSDRELWNLKRTEGMSPTAATAYVEARRLRQQGDPPLTWRDRLRNANNLAGSIAQGLTGGLADEVTSGIRAGADKLLRGQDFSESYDAEMERQRKEREDYREDYPGGANLGEVTGALMTGGVIGAGMKTLGAARAAAGAAPRAVGGGRRAAEVLGLGTAAGAGAGAAASDPGERGRGAVIGGGLGFATAGLVPAVAATGRGVGNVANAFGTRPATRSGSRAARAYPGRTSEEVAQDNIIRAMERDGVSFEEARRRIAEEMGDDFPATLMEVTAPPHRWPGSPRTGPRPPGGESTANLGRLAGNYPNDEIAELTGTLAERGANRPDRITNALARTTGLAPENVVVKAQTLVQQQKRNAAPLYEAAFQAPPVASPVISEALEIPVFRQAYEVGRNLAKVERVDIPPLADGGPQEFSVRAIDYMKKGLDALIERGGTSNNPIDRQTAVALRRRLNEVLDEVDTQLGGGDPEQSIYRTARRTWGGDQQALEALEAGRKFMQPSADSRVLAMEVAEMEPAARQLWRLGAIDAVRTALRRSDTRDPVRAVFGNAEIRDRMRLLFDDDASYQAFAQRMGLEATGRGVETSIMQGSRTAPMLMQADEAFGNAASGVADAALTGSPVAAFRGLSRDAIARRVSGMNSDVAAQMASRLSRGGTGTPEDRQLLLTLLEELEKRHAELARGAATRQGISTGSATAAGLLSGGGL